MRQQTRLIVATAGFLAVGSVLPAQRSGSAGDPALYRPTAERLITAAMADTVAYSRLARMTDTFGNRISGSQSLERAIDWVLARMRDDGFQNVRGEPVMVPHWVRGQESAELIKPRSYRLHMLGLGGSVATPAQGITASVLVVNNFDDLTAHAAQAKGKIVVFDFPFPTDVAPFQGYGTAVQYRGRGASAAAHVGAVAAFVRSVTPQSIQSPHTGAMNYDSTEARIPAAALSVEDVQMLHRMQDRGEPIELTLRMEAHNEPDAPSRNVVAEIVGSTKPDEIVVIGGHIDSWDVGEGAMDDGGGSFAAWEAVRLIKELGLHPRRTIRVVLWTNEENGGRGGRGYRDAHLAELPKHVAAIESDNGVFQPRGFKFQGSDSALAIARGIGSLLSTPRVRAPEVTFGDAEADVGPIIREGVPGFGLDVDGSKYFLYHHTEADMMTVIDREDLRRCIAAMAVMTYVLADMPDPLPRAAPARR